MPLVKRLLWQSLLGGFKCLAIAISLLINNAFDDYILWRIYFYISAAITAIALMLIMLLSQHIPIT